MSKLRLLAVTIFSIGLAFSSFGSLASTAKATDAPMIAEADAENTGGTTAKEAGDRVTVGFSEATNKFVINKTNIDELLVLSNDHSFRDGAGNIGSATWNSAGTELTITLSAGTSVPTVSVGDTITLDGTDIKNMDGERFTGTETIHGSFSSNEEDEDTNEDNDNENDNDNDDDEDCVVHTTSNRGNDHVNGHEDNDNDDDEDANDDCSDHGSMNHQCSNEVVNGKLYKIGTDATVYLAENCTLKPFRGAAVFHARGLEFQNIIVLAALPTGVTISGEPVLPVEGTLVKGTDKTVWFVGHNGKCRGFVSAEVFNRLGFKFDQVQEISDSDLGELPKEDSNISDESHHPDGALIKCSNSAAVFVVVGDKRYPFAGAEAFQSRGHSFEHILNVDCSRFAYSEGPPVTE